MQANASAGARTQLLRRLNVFGLDHLDAVLLAALASGDPLLLVGAHGGAKSALLNRFASALGLEHRHYNASLVSFDDLLGFPVPNGARDGLDYLRTPATLWDAESVFLDEISRCRPEVQNKLFAIVHERRVQGVALSRLRYRWAAMNPPGAFDDAGEPEDAYLGSQPLDPALADRFAFVVSLPSLESLAPGDRRLVIAAGHVDPPPAPWLAGLIDEARVAARAVEEASGAWTAGYVESLIAPLREAGLGISGRRAGMLYRAVAAIGGARSALGADAAIAEAALEALRWGLPQRAQGRAITESKLLAIHRGAIAAAGEPEDSPLRRLRVEPDPLKRIALALALPQGTLSRTAFSALVSDAFSAQDVAGRYLLARRLLPRLAERDAVNAPAYELLAAPLAKVVDFEREPSHRLELGRSEVARFNDMLAVVAKLRAEDPADASLANVLYTLFAVERVRADPAGLVERDRELGRLLAAPAGEACPA